MNMHYRVLSVDESEHTFVVRYWTDIISEIDMCSMFDSDGYPKLNANDQPIRCRTDFNISMSDILNPSVEQIKQHIMLSAPSKWFDLLEKIKTNSSEVSLSNVNSLIGTTETFIVNINDFSITTPPNTMNTVITIITSNTSNTI